MKSKPRALGPSERPDRLSDRLCPLSRSFLFLSPHSLCIAPFPSYRLSHLLVAQIAAVKRELGFASELRNVALNKLRKRVGTHFMQTNAQADSNAHRNTHTKARRHTHTRTGIYMHITTQCTHKPSSKRRDHHICRKAWQTNRQTIHQAQPRSEEHYSNAQTRRLWLRDARG